jgi:4-hydroxy-tetrahydrodipicolinate reductase
MNMPARLLIHGASGRMGQALLRLGAAEADLRLVAAVNGDGQAAGGHLPWFAAADIEQVPDFDIAIDFSRPEGLLPLLALCRRRQARLVSGTTGLDAGQREALTAASKHVAVLWAANFSLGVAVLGALVERAAAALSAWDVDIVELHHAGKRDAPSGTALRLAAAVAGGGGRPAVQHSLRAGDAVGEHCVQFSGAGERLELIHRATDRDVFARGALFASRWLAAQPAGLYRLEDALGAALRGD